MDFLECFLNELGVTSNNVIPPSMVRLAYCFGQGSQVQFRYYHMQMFVIITARSRTSNS